MANKTFPTVPAEGLRLTNLLILPGGGRAPIVNGSLVIKGDQVLAIGSPEGVKKQYPDAKEWDGGGFMATPGFVNAHTHCPMGFFRGSTHAYVPKSSDSSMIEDVFYPAERALTPELIEPLSYSYILDGLRSGVTTFVDAYFDEIGVGQALERFGVRGFIGEHIADLGGPKPAGKELWEKTKKLMAKWPFSSRVQPVVYAHAADTVSGPLLKELAEFARKEKLPFHMHLSQTAGERSRVLKREKVSPVMFAKQCGALFPGSLVVHLVSADDADCKVLADSGATVGLCAISEIQYESLPPLELFWKHKLPVVLGTDSAASNDTGDIMRELHFTALLLRQKGLSVAPREMLGTITENAAQVLRAPVGTLAEGKKADLVLLRIDATTLPLIEPEANLVYSCTSRHVRHVMVDGQWVLWDQMPVKIAEADINESYQKAVEEIWRRVKR